MKGQGLHVHKKHLLYIHLAMGGSVNNWPSGGGFVRDAVFTDPDSDPILIRIRF
jgi:hypothetical protein